jgi:hypothetical protein
VSAEELAPFLDPPRLPRRLPSGPNKYEDEAFVLPALIRLGGEPFVDERGGLLYRFPALQVRMHALAGTRSGGRAGAESAQPARDGRDGLAFACCGGLLRRVGALNLQNGVRECFLLSSKGISGHARRTSPCLDPQVAASELPRGQQQAVVPLEREWEFSAASPGARPRGFARAAVCGPGHQVKQLWSTHHCTRLSQHCGTSQAPSAAPPRRTWHPPPRPAHAPALRPCFRPTTA